jgi:hypothetical protein
MSAAVNPEQLNGHVKFLQAAAVAAVAVPAAATAAASVTP